MPKEIIAKPLNRKEFEPFGEVIEIDSTVEAISINDGYAIRYNDLATVDVLASRGRPLINIFRADYNFFFSCYFIKYKKQSYLF